MPDIHDDDLFQANEKYNKRLAAAGVPDDGPGTVTSGLINGDLFDVQDAASMAEGLGTSYAEAALSTLSGMATVAAAHGIALGVLAERERWDRLQRQHRVLQATMLQIATGRSLDPMAAASGAISACQAISDGTANGSGERNPE